ncbi:MAG: hypothetical protein H7141_08000 [Burkholderiales bacterium]|nr:hypothetical protein [Bacteroidia bacterium]
MRITIVILCVLFFISFASCKSCKDKKSTDETPEDPIKGPSVENTLGYGVLNKVKGIWNGPVSSTTPLGGYPEWIVDFRPISENQISAKNELDTLNDIFMSFFIVKYNNQYKVAFRNGGSFGGMKRVSYFLADSVSETSAQSFYRFAEVVKGRSRAFTEVIRKSDSLIVKSYTNKYNTQTSATPHMTWRAKLQDSTSYAPAVSAFGFPKNTMTKDFSSSFVGITEAIYYNTTSEPYPESVQPYLGKTTVNYTHSASYTPNSNNKTFLVICTQPLFIAGSINLKNRSRYVILAANDLNFTFNYMHPGSYYAYAMYDKDGSGIINSGDWISATGTPFNLAALGTTTVNTAINFQIP